MLTPERIKEIMAVVYSNENKNRIKNDYELYKIYNGKLREIIEAAIYDEFVTQGSVRDLVQRVIPINIVQKICNKLAKVYLTAPIRKPVEDLEQDEESLSLYEKLFSINKHMKFANRMLKLYKHTAIEPYIDRYGHPQMRVLPAFQYTPVSNDPIDPNTPTEFVKHLNFDDKKEQDRHIIWDNDTVVTVNGNGDIIVDEANPNFVNEYGVIPICYIKENDDQLIPMQDSDLKAIQIAICLLLTDLAFATKYQAFSILYMIGATTGKIPINPNAIVNLPIGQDGERPEIGFIKPEIDSDAMLRQVEALVGLLLTSKSLSIGSVSTKLDGANPVSGIAKILDNAESTEDRQDQIEIFRKSEQKFWQYFAHNILPVWTQNGVIDPNDVSLFTPNFELQIIFPDQKQMISEKDQLETIALKLEKDLTSYRRALMEANPQLDDNEIDELINEINQEKFEKVSAMKVLSDENNDDELQQRADEINAEEADTNT